MFYTNENCCICFNNKQPTHRLSELQDNGISFYSKLISCVPEMYFQGLNDQFLICKECGDILNVLYNLHLKCLCVNKHKKQIYWENDSCYICLNNKQSLRSFSEKQNDGMMIHFKLAKCVPKMCLEDINNQNRICDACCDILNTFYNFNQKCLQNKSFLIGYVSKLNSANKNNSNTISVYKEEIIIKEEFIETESKDENEIDDYDLKSNNKHIFNSNMEHLVRIKEEPGTQIKLENISGYVQNRNNEVNITPSNIKMEVNKLNLEDSAVKHCDKKCSSDNPGSVLRSEIKIEVDELNSEYEPDPYKQNTGREFAFVNVNMDSVNDMKIETNDEDQHGKSRECNIRNSAINSEDISANIKKEVSDSSENSDDGVYSLNSIGNYDEIKFEEHDVKLEENCIDEQGSSNEGSKTSLRKKEAKTEITCEANANEKHNIVYKCSECFKTLVNKESLRRHMLIHSGIKSHSCLICNKKFTLAFSLKEHMLIHSSEFPYKCTVCNKKLTNARYLKLHMLIHTGEKTHECTVCNKKFAQAFKLKTHMFCHTGEKSHECTVCNKKFKYSSSVKTHMLMHTERKPHECTVCDKKFTQASTLKTHMLIHTEENPYECTLCNKKFTDASKLKRHMLIHTEEKPYKCTICNKTYIQASNLKTHMLLHTGERPYECTVCNKKFTQAFNLKTHMLVHSEEKPHECTVCKKKFRQTSNLKTHMLIHTEENPHECPLCNRKFIQAYKLKRHILIHTEGKPHECLVCNKKFTLAHNLKAHMLLHTRENAQEHTVCDEIKKELI